MSTITGYSLAIHLREWASKVERGNRDRQIRAKLATIRAACMELRGIGAYGHLTGALEGELHLTKAMREVFEDVKTSPDT